MSEDLEFALHNDCMAASCKWKVQSSHKKGIGKGSCPFPHLPPPPFPFFFLKKKTGRLCARRMRKLLFCVHSYSLECAHHFGGLYRTRIIPTFSFHCRLATLPYAALWFSSWTYFLRMGTFINILSCVQASTELMVRNMLTSPHPSFPLSHLRTCGWISTFCW